MSEVRFSSTTAPVLDAWHTSDLPDEQIADVAAALARYDRLNAELAEYRRAADASIATHAAQVVAGNATFADALTSWTTSIGGRQQGPGGRYDDAFHNECRRHARRAVELELRRIDWSAIMTDDRATDELRYAIRQAGLAA
ncbi:MAG: hypothetical protein R2697_19155 [Ilumatobacteraceae bacterium]